MASSLRLLSLALAATFAAIAAAVPAGDVEVLREAEGGLELRWRPGDGPARLHRLALPAGTRLALLPTPGAVALRESVTARAPGWVGRVRFQDLVLDPAAVPAPARRRPFDLRLAFVEDTTGDAASPPAVASEGELRARALAPTSTPILDRALRADLDLGPAATDARGAPGDGGLLGATALNPRTARALAARAATDRLAWPSPPLLAPARGQLWRRLAAPAKSAVGGGPRRAPDLPRSDAPAGLEGGRVKILVDRDGVYRITHAQVAALGVDLGNVPLADLRVTNRGAAHAPREVAIHVVDGDGDGLFSPPDVVELWGAALTDDHVENLWQNGDYTDVNAYFLDALPGTRLRMAERSGAPDSGYPRAADFLETAHAERNDIFLANHQVGTLNVDHFYWCPYLRWTSSSGAVERTEGIDLPGLVAGSARGAAVRVHLLGRFGSDTDSPDHRSEIDVGGTTVSTRDGDGNYVEEHGVALSAAALTARTDVTVRLPGPPAGASEYRFYLDWIEIDYPRAFAAVEGRLDFTHATGASVVVTGLLSDDVVALDVTDPINPVRLTGLAPAGGQVEVDLDGTGDLQVAVASFPGAPPLQPKAIEWVPDPGLRDPTLAVDLLVVGPRAWLEPPLPALQRYVAHRQGEGLRVLTVTTEAMIDELSEGIFTPFALGVVDRDLDGVPPDLPDTPGLLELAATTWATPPRWCLLLGDATNDLKDDLAGLSIGHGDCLEVTDSCGFNETAWVQHVPTRLYDNPFDQVFLGYYASDALLSMVVGPDAIPDVNVGRLPARTAAQVEAMLDKIVAYEQQRGAPPAWAARVITSADEIDPMVPLEQELERAQDDAVAAHVPAAYPRSSAYYNRPPYSGTDQLSWTADFLGAWADPAASAGVLSFVGHGNTFAWSNDGLFEVRGARCRNDVRDALTGPTVPTPVVYNADCITGGFMHQVGPSLLEEMVRAPEGGAIAAFGPTGITDLVRARGALDAFYAAVYGADGRGLRLGDVILRVQVNLADQLAQDELFNNALLGDPSMQLLVPFAPPAATLRGTPGDGLADLDWDSTTPPADTTTLYRSDSGPAGPWSVVATGLTGLVHQDAGLENGRLYHYALEPVKGGWPGRWSNRVAVRPCSPLPPEPPGPLTAFEGDCTGELALFWDPSPTANLQGYVVRVFRGLSTSGVPEQQFVAASGFSIVPGLVPFRTYTFQVTALSWCDLESVPTNTAVQRCVCPLTLRPPAFVRDLRARRVGDDIVLTWSDVTADISGAPLVPSGYVVHRSTDPAFLASAATEVGRVPTPGLTDPGRGVQGGPVLEVWAVAAESASGERGGLGHDFPQPVRALLREPVGSQYRLSWRATTHDILGDETALGPRDPAPLGWYHVYAAATPLRRDNLAGLTPVTVPGDTTELLIDQAQGAFHFVVAEDVHGNLSP
jgi:hypothetical protein